MNNEDQFTEFCRVRITNEQEVMIGKIVKANEHLYNNKSHFIRCAVLKLIREHERLPNLVKTDIEDVEGEK